MQKDLHQLVAQAAAKGASDIHLIYGLPPMCRVYGELSPMRDLPLSHEDCEAYAMALAGNAYEKIKSIGELDLARDFDGQRTRINLFRQQGHVSASIRLIAREIPALESLGLPPIVDTFPAVNRGLIIVTGETGSGKSTTLAAIIDRINKTRKEHIITLEDPIEYVYDPELSIINQREIGIDTASYADGLRAAMREDPDVILLGEMRDLPTIAAALTAAETGHLVFSTLHTNSAVDSIDRIVDIFPGDQQGQIRTQLSTTLYAVIAQQLLRRATGDGRVCACEVMMVTPAIRNLIREGKGPQMANALATSSKEGSITMDNSIVGLYKSRIIDRDTAIAAAHDGEFVARMAAY
jgi:twitching motility protein PilT